MIKSEPPARTESALRAGAPRESRPLRGHPRVIQLRHHTPKGWVAVVEHDLIAFLQDHAANERKVSHSALTLVAQHPDRHVLVDTLIDVAREELAHFRRVYDLLAARGQTLAFDAPDPYMGALRNAVKQSDATAYLLDRLVLFGIIEARGRERFALLAKGLADEELRAFYQELTRAEERHQALYDELARTYFEDALVDQRLDALLDLEAEVARAQPLRPALH